MLIKNIHFQLSFIQLSLTATAGPKINAGQSHALFSQAMAHLLGTKGQGKFSKIAFKKFEMLAQQGWKTTQHMLGNMYLKGEGTSQNKVQAYLWYSLAAKKTLVLQRRKSFIYDNIWNKRKYNKQTSY